MELVNSRGREGFRCQPKGRRHFSRACDTGIAIPPHKQQHI
jgi:hypothetical protein